MVQFTFYLMYQVTHSEKESEHLIEVFDKLEVIAQKWYSEEELN